MFKWFFQGNDYLTWPLVGLGIFIIAFVLVLFYVFVVMRRDEDVQRLARLPLDDDAIASLEEEGVRE
jgi:cbb3-type cytochrome oxidase subunit 3